MQMIPHRQEFDESPIEADDVDPSNFCPRRPVNFEEFFKFQQ
jgi:hypothetical protein